MLNRASDGWRNSFTPGSADRQSSTRQANPNIEGKKFTLTNESIRLNPLNRRYLEPASHANQWENRNRPRDDNDLLLGHDHAPASGGNISLWNTPVVLSPRSPRIGEGRRKYGSTLRSRKLRQEARRGRKSDHLRPTEIVTNSGDSVRAARSIVRERAQNDGVLGAQVNAMECVLRSWCKFVTKSSRPS